MLSAIRANAAPVGSSYTPNRQNTRSNSLVQDCEDRFSRQHPESMLSHLASSVQDTAKFAKFRGSVKLTKELVEGSVGNQKALLALAKEAAKDEDSKQEMIGYLIDLQESSIIHKNRRSIYEASKQHLHSDGIENNFKSSFRGFMSASDEHVNWSIAPC